MADRNAWLAQLADELYLEMVATAEAVATELAPPPVAADGRSVTRAQYIAHARRMSHDDPTYMQRDLDRMAPASIPGPDGTMLRARAGLKNYIAKWTEARPDVHARHAVSQPGPPGGIDA